jgi:hypothetical protein
MNSWDDIVPLMTSKNLTWLWIAIAAFGLCGLIGLMLLKRKQTVRTDDEN